MSIEIKTKTLLSIDGHGDIEVSCYTFHPDGSLYVEMQRDNVTWLTRAFILEGVSFDYRIMSSPNKEVVHAMIIRGGK